MNIDEIKASLGYNSLQLNRSEDAKGDPTDWFRHWDNANRVAVSIHQDTLEMIESNPKLDTLALQAETREGDQGPYEAFRIVAYKPAERVL